MKKQSTIKNFKLLNIILLSLSIGVTGSLLVGCNSGSEETTTSQSSANSSMLVNLKSSFITNQPLLAGQKYTLVANDTNGSILSNQSISCDSFELCQVAINGLNNTSSDQIYLRILDANGGLIAAQSLNLHEYIKGIHQVNSTPVVFSEVSTGNYILDKMSQVGFTLISGYNGDIEDDVSDVLDLDNDRHPELVLPTGAYIAVQQLGAGKSEASGILRFWYSIYGDDNDDGLNVNYDGSNILTTNKFGINYSNIDVLTTAISEANSASTISTANQTKRSTQAACISTLANQVVDKDVIEAARVAASMILKNTAAAQPPANKEQQQNIKIVKGALSIAFNAINIAAPGVGSILAFSSSTLLDFFYPQEKSDPNSAIIKGLNNIDSSINRFANLYQMDSENKSTNSVYERFITNDDLNSALIINSNLYVNMLNSGATLATKARVKINYDDPNFIYGSLIDDYITYNKNRKNALKEVEGLFNTPDRANKIVQLATQVSDEKRITLFMDEINQDRSKKINRLNQDINDSDVVDYSALDLIQIDEGYYAQVLSLETSIIRALDKARNLQLGAAYLKIDSKYTDELGVIYISEPGIPYIDYEETAQKINDLYQSRMTTVVETFKSKLAKSDTTTISKAATYYDPELLKTVPGKSKPKCSITYWDGVNLETRCPNLGANGTDIVERISNVKSTCGANKIQLHGTRLYCETQLVNNVTMPEAWLQFGDTNITGTRLHLYSSNLKVIEMGAHMYSYICPTQSRYCTAGQRIYGLGYKDMSKDVEYDYNTRIETESGSKFAFMTKGAIRSWSWMDTRDLWASLGCVTSDCKVIADSEINEMNKGIRNARETQQIYFSNGDVLSLANGNLGSGGYMLTSSSSTQRPLPGGQWLTYCDYKSAILQNGVLTARCSNVEWNKAHNNNVKETSRLNLDKQCKLGSPVEVNGSGKLKCKNSK